MPTPEMPDRATLAMRVVVTAVLSGLAAWSFRAAFGDTAGPAALWAVVAPVAAVTVWGCLTVYLGRSIAGTGATVLGVLAVAVAVAAVTRPGADVRLGPARLLTGELPADPAGPELATVSALAGLTALVAVRLALRARTRLVPLAPPLCCLLLGLGLGATVAPLPGWYVPAFAVTAAAFLLVAPAGSGRAGTGRLVVGTAMALVAGAVGTLLGPLATADRQPVSVQALVAAPVTPREDTNPLVRYLALRNEIIQVKATGTASRRVDLIRMVTFDRFDGREWTVSGDYRRVGTRLPGPPHPPVAQQPVELNVELENAGFFGWLPRVGWPSRLNVPNLGFDRTTGDVVVPAGQDTPRKYTIVGDEPAGRDQLSADDPARTENELGVELPRNVDAFLRAATYGHPTGRDQFYSLYDSFTDGTFSRDTSDDAPGGHSLYHISKLLDSKRGTSEQYASAFAVLCRAMGWDARVVLGFRPKWTGNAFTIQGKDVFAWVEVRFDRLGWITVNPTPSRTTSEGQRDTAGDASQPVVPKDDVPGARPDQQAPRVPSQGSAGPQHAAVSPPASSPVLWIMFAVAGVVLLAGAFAVPAAKALRRARARHAGSPRQRAMAAWRDTVESVRGAGVDVDRSATTGEVVRGVPKPLAASVSLLGELVDRAMFAPEGITEDDARNAWQRNEDIRGWLWKDMSLGRRLRNALDPRSLLPRRAVRAYEVSPA